MQPPRLAAWVPAVLLLLLCAQDADASWRDNLKSGSSIHPLGGKLDELLQDAEGRADEGVSVVVLINAHQNYFSQCKQCALLDEIMKQTAQGYHRAFRKGEGLSAIRFASVDYTRGTQALMAANKKLAVPSMFLITPETRNITDVHIFTKQALIELEQAGKAPSAFAEVGGLQNRRFRRSLDRLPAHLIDAAVIGKDDPVTGSTVARWLGLLTKVAFAVKEPAKQAAPQQDKGKAAAAASGGSGFSFFNLVVMLVALVATAAFAARAFYPVSEDDVVQKLARANGWWLAFIFHAVITGGLHWCVLVCRRETQIHLRTQPAWSQAGAAQQHLCSSAGQSFGGGRCSPLSVRAHDCHTTPAQRPNLQHGAAPMGNSMFMPGRRGQYLIEGLIVTGYVMLGSYSLLALHRMSEHLAVPDTLFIAADRVVAGGASELIRVALVGITFAVVLTIFTFLHKNYWYLRGTYMRDIFMPTR